MKFIKNKIKSWETFHDPGGDDIMNGITSTTDPFVSNKNGLQGKNVLNPFTNFYKTHLLNGYKKKKYLSKVTVAQNILNANIDNDDVYEYTLFHNYPFRGQVNLLNNVVLFMINQVFMAAAYQFEMTSFDANLLLNCSIEQDESFKSFSSYSSRNHSTKQSFKSISVKDTWHNFMYGIKTLFNFNKKKKYRYNNNNNNNTTNHTSQTCKISTKPILLPTSKTADFQNLKACPSAKKFKSLGTRSGRMIQQTNFTKTIDDIHVLDIAEKMEKIDKELYQQGWHEINFLDNTSNIVFLFGIVAHNFTQDYVHRFLLPILAPLLSRINEGAYLSSFTGHTTADSGYGESPISLTKSPLTPSSHLNVMTIGGGEDISKTGMLSTTSKPLLYAKPIYAQREEGEWFVEERIKFNFWSYFHDELFGICNLHGIIVYHLKLYLYVAFCYLGNEISYPVKPFIITDDSRTSHTLKSSSSSSSYQYSSSFSSTTRNDPDQTNQSADCRERFWMDCLDIVKHSSSMMLEINAKRELFYERWKELIDMPKIENSLQSFSLHNK